MEEKTVPNIDLTPVQSSQIHAIGYDAASGTLRIQFKGAAGPGSRYDYPGVPAETAEAFQKAESVGKFFGAHIKGKFTFTKLPAPGDHPGGSLNTTPEVSPARIVPGPAALDLESDQPLSGGNSCSGEVCESCQ